MNTPDFEKLARQARLTTLSSGWNLQSLNKEGLSERSIFFYLFDSSSKKVWSCSIDKQSFDSFVNTLASKVSVSDAAGYAGKAIREAFVKHLSMNDVEIKDLAMALSLYFSKTKSYQSSINHDGLTHFCIIYYSSTKMLRPFLLDGSGFSFLVAEDVLLSFAKVISIDVINHPDWVTAGSVAS